MILYGTDIETCYSGLYALEAHSLRSELYVLIIRTFYALPPGKDLVHAHGQKRVKY
jgi:hypothetical protein